MSSRVGCAPAVSRMADMAVFAETEVNARSAFFFAVHAVWIVDSNARRRIYG